MATATRHDFIPSATFDGSRGRYCIDCGRMENEHLVARDTAVAPTLFRSMVTLLVVHIEDLDECSECAGHGTIPHYERVRVDDHGWKMAVEYTTCRTCGGGGLVEPLTMHGTTVLGRVEPLVGTEARTG